MDLANLGTFVRVRLAHGSGGAGLSMFSTKAELTRIVSALLAPLKRSYVIPLWSDPWQYSPMWNLTKTRSPKPSTTKTATRNP